MTENSLAGFMSYVHWDDKGGKLTALREHLSDEVQVHTGIEFPIFQDRNDIKWGQNWRERIDNSVDEVTFLIPIITPGFFKSIECRRELQRFIEREKQLGRNDLILPIYFVDTPLLNEPELRATDELAEVIASRHYADWRELRFEPFTNPQVAKKLAQLAVQIRDALSRVHTPKKAIAKHDAVSAPQPTGATTGQGIEPPTRIVDSMHSGDFATISEAIKSVEPGTRIIVRRGLYKEGLVIDKPLEIIGDGKPGDVIIQVSGMSVILFQTTMGRIVNLTLRQMGGLKFFGVKIAQGRLELEDCDITCHSLSCVAIRGGANPTLRRNRIHDSERGNGVDVSENAEGTLEDNDIFGNKESGVAIKDGGNPTLRRNRIYDHSKPGVSVAEGGQGTLEDNDIFSNGSGLLSMRGGNPVVRNNRINKNKTCGVIIYGNGGGTFENNDLTKNRFGAWSIAEDSKANVKQVNNKEKLLSTDHTK